MIAASQASDAVKGETNIAPLNIAVALAGLAQGSWLSTGPCDNDGFAVHLLSAVSAQQGVLIYYTKLLAMPGR